MASCPKCGAEWAMGAKECPQCGVIYARYKYTPPKRAKVGNSTKQGKEWAIIGGVGVIFAVMLYIADPAWWVYVVFLALVPAIAIAWECFRAKRNVSSIVDGAAIDVPVVSSNDAAQPGGNACISFQYCDVNGLETRRTVDIYRLYKRDDAEVYYIDGYCHTRGAERTFRLDRIMSDIIDRQTGEMLTSRELVRRYGGGYF